MSTWKVADKVDIFLDATVLMAEGKADGHTVAHTQSLCLKNYDMIYSLEAGLKFNLGKSTWAKVPDVDALMAMNKEQLDALNASLRDAQAENARLKNLLANQKPVAETKEVVKKELATTAQSVFFNINKSKIASRKDLVNVQEVAKYAKANGNKIVVTGYADSKTGKAAYNQALSQKRAEAVANELVKMGVSRDNIIVKAAGGVNDLSPISYNRRATVELQ
jgi:outer membrane protein OmpA-like peptidoglycan-associated protein